MTLIIEIVLALGLAALSLLVYMMIRQVGVVTRRLPYQRITAATVVEALPAGAECPVTELPADAGELPIRLPLVPGTTSFLLFTSFSCSKCRAILESLPALPEDARDRLAVMVLDAGFRDYFATEIARLGLDGLRLVDAYALATPFQVVNVPFLYTVDADLRIADGTLLVTPRDLRQRVRASRSPAPALNP